MHPISTLLYRLLSIEKKEKNFDLANSSLTRATEKRHLPTHANNVLTHLVRVLDPSMCSTQLDWLCHTDFYTISIVVIDFLAAILTVLVLD